MGRGGQRSALEPILTASPHLLPEPHHSWQNRIPTKPGSYVPSGSIATGLLRFLRLRGRATDRGKGRIARLHPNRAGLRARAASLAYGCPADSLRQSFDTLWYSRFRNGSRTRAGTLVCNVIRKALSVNERSRGSLLGPRPVHMRRVYTRRTGITPAILPRHRPPPARLVCFPCSYWKNRKAPRDWLDVPENPPVHGERMTAIGRPC